ncbi:unnamed protein product [Paramecium primaurelia]|uniref:Uncharacterized protein n=1 Tax=Paramecium primaurelia TaxID=5886 RepID=A0A8S1QRL0_PARPR|nr:unnamed protein product [Paramecium primaurelia]
MEDRFVQRQEKQEKLNQQIAIMRKIYNQQLNEINEKLITEFSLQINKTGEICKFKQNNYLRIKLRRIVFKYQLFDSMQQRKFGLRFQN